MSSVQLSEVKPLIATCANSPGGFVQLTGYVNHLVQIASLIEKPEMGIDLLIQNLGTQLLSYLNPSPWPNINEQARLAKVPILMYHDFLPKKEVFFDVTPEEFEQHLQLIKQNGLTPITLDQLVTHLRTGLPLPKKPILLTFDDAYGSHYQYVYPLLKKYGYPGLFSIYTLNIGKNTGRTHVTWDQLREMVANPLVTISAHSVTHPRDVTVLPDDQLRMEIVDSKRILEEHLGIPIRYFTYPEGKYDARVETFVQAAGYEAALTMNDLDDRFAGQSKNLLAIDRIGQSNLRYAIAQSWGGSQLASWNLGYDFTAPLTVTKTKIDKIPLILISGGRPITIHAKHRDQVSKILAGTEALAGVDGGFFSLKTLESNTLLGPVLSQNENQFIPDTDTYNITKAAGRPLVLISPQAVKFTPFDPTKHNTLEGIQSEMPNVTDAFVGAGWLVKDNQPQSLSSFGNLYSVNEPRYRAFWGLNQSGQPTVGISTDNVGAVNLGVMLAKAGFKDAIMLDSGQSTSLAYKGQLLTHYLPRPVPHVVALIPPLSATDTSCAITTPTPSQKETEKGESATRE
ncbi:MAG: polysaccharide deacetylase family protein [Chamaesiphon sp.]